MVIGLTGGIGTGKTTVANFFKKNPNVAVYIADKEAKELMVNSLEIKEAIIKEFGDGSYKGNLLNRPYIANIVFKNKSKLQVLNNIVHPVVASHFKKFVKDNSHKAYVLYENAILFENGSDILCDVIITVTAPLQERIKRVLARDKTTEKEVLNRIKNQWDEEKKILQSHYVIHNSNLTETEQQVNLIHNILTENY